mmetsp:Transcript_63209/g.150747  ORF Transcript_63209/g.150747 Transcript_63209/m.150747 type:complete len:153 (-) Transcript_63209:163-621(-)
MGCGASAKKKYGVPEVSNPAPKILKKECGKIKDGASGSEDGCGDQGLPDPDTNIFEAFREIDEDDNGVLTEDEIHAVMCKPSLGLALGNAEIARMLAGVAKYVDGKVDRMDFVNAYWARLMVVRSTEAEADSCMRIRFEDECTETSETAQPP